jgi:PAS domain S-box-containing protein
VFECDSIGDMKAIRTGNWSYRELLAASVLIAVVSGIVFGAIMHALRYRLGFDIFVQDIVGTVVAAVLVLVLLRSRIRARRQVDSDLQELSLVRERLDMALEGGNLGLWDWWVKEGLLTVNARWAGIIGYTQEELGPVSIETWQRLCHPQDLERVNELLVEHFDGREKHFECECRMLHKDGGWVWVYTSGRVMERDQQSRPVRMVGTHTDITQRKVTDIDLEETTIQSRQLLEKAEEASRAKSLFLANMSHEIRTPLNGVIGMTYMLSETRMDERQQIYVETIRQSGESLLALVNDILDFSKIEAGKLELEVTEFDLRDLVDDFGAVMASAAHAKGLELVCSVVPRMPALLRGDPLRLRQILINLVGNAIKFTANGHVVMRVAEMDRSIEDVTLRFSIQDTGIGIPADKLSGLFQIFTQVDASTTRKFGGTGLGLAISRQLVQKMDGEIGVNPGESGGTEFWFSVRLPLGAPRRHEEPLNLHRARILVVSPSLPLSADLRERLTSMGARVHLARSVSEGLEILGQRARKFAMVIVDADMAGGAKEGSLLAAIRHDDRSYGVPVVALERLGRQGSGHLYEHILSKPLHRRHLRELLTHLLASEDSNFPEPVSSFFFPEPHLPIGAKVLLVEDNLVNQMVAQGMLESMGLVVDIANNGLEAVDAWRANSYRLVLMDCQMPEMNGFDATRSIRSSDPARQIPIIAMTANATKQDQEACFAVGMDDFIVKPLVPQHLSEVLGRWLGHD